MPVFQMKNGKVTQLSPAPFANEKALQLFVEKNLEELLGVRFVATEFPTGEKHGGRIDTLGIDEEGNPVIVEYKLGEVHNVMNQGLFYLDWLLDHKGDFELAVQSKLGKQVEVSWSEPRLILIASAYTKYDKFAVNQLTPTIELLRYQQYDHDTFTLESVNEPISAKDKKAPKPPGKHPELAEYTLDYHRAKTAEPVWAAFLELRDDLLALEGVEERVNQKSQISYRTTKSFAAIGFRKGGAQCQFKGPEVIDDPEQRAKDIRSYRWGYQWAVEVADAVDVAYAFKLLKGAYDREQ